LPGWRVVAAVRFIKRVNDRGTLTLPSDVRDAMGVEEGDIVEFEVLGIVKKRAEAPGTRVRRTVTAPDVQLDDPAANVRINES
jgi:AbrB family looped-hinge helix DNA binding protein